MQAKKHEKKYAIEVICPHTLVTLYWGETFYDTPKEAREAIERRSIKHIRLIRAVYTEALL